PSPFDCCAPTIPLRVQSACASNTRAASRDRRDETPAKNKSAKNSPPAPIHPDRVVGRTARQSTPARVSNSFRYGSRLYALLLDPRHRRIRHLFPPRFAHRKMRTPRKFFIFDGRARFLIFSKIRAVQRRRN